MNILYVASEAVPFIKSGGLADVVGTLPPAVSHYADDVYVMLPKYSLIDDYFKVQMKHIVSFNVSLGWRNQYCGIELIEYQGVKFFFIDNEYYFDRSYIYGDLTIDECERFSFFAKAVLDALPLIEINPDIIHCNDWQCGMIPFLLKTQYSSNDFYKNIKTVYTIHNISYQGIFNWEWSKDILSIPDCYFCDTDLEFYGRINFMKAGIVYSDIVSTVSKSYAKEITNSDLGENLQGILNAKQPPIHGILNGIDNSQYSPYDDIHLEHHYAISDLSGKAKCKESLQYELWLDKEPDTPLLSIVSRLTEQKGLLLIEHTWEKLMDMGVELAIIGTGDKHFESFFSWLAMKCGGRVATRIEYNEHMSRRIYAGSDIFLMPSRTEPCGLAQMIALRYGTIPIVHETGGLLDSIEPYNKYTGEGIGFTFYDYTEDEFINAVSRAILVYNDKSAWEKLMLRAMQTNFSWEQSAVRYMDMYRELIDSKK